MQLQFKVLENKDIISYRDVLKRYIKELLQPYIKKELLDEVERVYNNMNKYTMNNTATIISAFDNNNLVGFIWGYKKIEEPMIVHINYFYVNEKYRGNGVGTNLLKQIETNIKDISELELLVDRDNENAIKFYKNNGFEVKDNDIEKIKLRRKLKK